MVLRIQRLNDGTLAYRAFPRALADNSGQRALYALKFPNLYIDLRDFIDRLRAYYDRKTTEKALVEFSIP